MLLLVGWARAVTHSWLWGGVFLKKFAISSRRQYVSPASESRGQLSWVEVWPLGAWK